MNKILFLLMLFLLIGQTQATEDKFYMQKNSGVINTISTPYDNAPQYTIDNDTAVFWRGNSTYPHWIIWDMGKQVSSSKVNLTLTPNYGGVYRAKVYNFSYSDDNVSWTQIFGVADETLDINETAYPAVVGRYFRLFIIDADYSAQNQDIIQEVYLFAENYTQTISVCQNITSNGSYTLTADLTATDGCLVIGANNITIDMMGKTINYSTGSGGGVGVNNTGFNNFTIKNGTIHQGNTSRFMSNFTHGIYSDGDDTNITNVNVSVYTDASYGIYGFTSSRMNVSDSTIFSGGQSGRSIYLSSSSDNGIIHNNVINSTFGYGILLESSTLANATSNSFKTDSSYPIWITGNFNHSIGNSNIVSDKPIYYYYNNNNTIIQNLNAGFIYVTSTSNITITNISSSNGVVFSQVTDSMVNNSNLNSTGFWVYGLYLISSTNNTIKNSNMNVSGDGSFAGFIFYSDLNIFKDNSFKSYGYSGYGLVLSTSNNNNFTNDSILLSATGSQEIYQSTSSNYFRNVSLTGKKVYFVDASSIFRYEYTDSGNVWVSVNLSGAGYIKRTGITNWSQNLTIFTENTSSPVNGYYNVTGLTPNTIYTVVNMTNNGKQYIQTFTSDASGNILDFTIKLTNESDNNIRISSNPTITSWGNNITNNDSITPSLNISIPIKFNASANQDITTWNWTRSGIAQNNNFDNFTTSWTQAGTKTIIVNATNANGTSNSITWTVDVGGLDDDGNVNLYHVIDNSSGNGGNDLCTGQQNHTYAEDSTNCAWATVGASSVLTAGQTVNIYSGTYTNEHITLTNSGTLASPITYRGIGTAPVLNGTDLTGIAIYSGNGVNYLIFDNINITRYSRGIQFYGGDNETIINSYFYNQDQEDIFCDYCSNYSIENNTFYGTNANPSKVWMDESGSITVNIGDHFTIKNNTFTNTTSGAVMTQPALYVTLINNTFSNTGRVSSCGDFVESGSLCNYWTIENNILLNGWDRGFRFDQDSSGHVFRNNSIYGMGSAINLYPNTTFVTITGNYLDDASMYINNIEDSVIENNIFYSKTRSQTFDHGLPHRNVTVRNNVFEAGGCAFLNFQDSVFKNNIFSNLSLSCYFTSVNNVTFTYNDVYNSAVTGIIQTNGITSNPQFYNIGNKDFHEKSKIGRYNSTSKAWETDSVQSAVIDMGNPSDSYSNEPAPNGNRINMGAYGNTAEASKSYSFPISPQSAYKTSTCQSTLGWGETGSALLIVLIVVMAGGLAAGFLTGTLKIDSYPIVEFSLVLIGVLFVGSIGVAIINPIIIAVGCP